MKTFIIDEFNYEVLSHFIQFSNDYWEFPWTIIIDCEGGSALISENILNLLSTHAENFQTKVICNRAFVTAFMLLRALHSLKTVELSFSYGCIGMVKLSEANVTLNTKLETNYNHDSATIRALQEVRKREIYEIERFLDAKEKKSFLKGLEIWFDYKRMIEIFNDNT